MIAARAKEPDKAKAEAPGQKAKQQPAYPKKPAFNPLWERLALGVQAKLAVSAPDDPYEREADQVAERVMRMPEPSVQRKCAACEEEEKLQRKESRSTPDTTTTIPPVVHEALSTPGQPLDSATKDFFEPRFGQDFGSVRVHADRQASQAAEDVAAQAFTVGRDIVFGSGQYAPETVRGRRLLAHELTHVVQQGGGSPQRVRTPAKEGSATGGALLGGQKGPLNFLSTQLFGGGVSAQFTVRNSRDPLEDEADRAASQALDSHAAPPVIEGAAGGAAGQPLRHAPDVEAVLAARGAPLAPPLRDEMERRFHHDFSGVRLHTDSVAGESARALRARAYTARENIVFAGGNFAPETAAGRRLLAHELTHVVQQRRGNADGVVQRDPDTSSGVAVDSPLDKPADQVVRGVTYHAVWDAANQFWDFQDERGRSIYSTTVEAPDPTILPRFWAAVDAAGRQMRAKQLVDDAVKRMLQEQGDKLRDIQRQIDELRCPPDCADDAGHPSPRHAELVAERQKILDQYDPSKQRASYLPPPVRASLPYSPKPQYAPDIVPEQGAPFGTYGGQEYAHEALRTSASDAYAYDIETSGTQVANDLERLARARGNYRVIHVATGAHANRSGAVTAPAPELVDIDLKTIKETQARHPGLKIVGYNMANPSDAARFYETQALAAEGKLPGEATLAGICFSAKCVPGLETGGAGTPGSASYLHGGFAAAAGALSIYGGTQDPNRTVGALKIAGGGAQVAGGVTYVIGYATESAGLTRLGSTVGEAGGYIAAALGLYDFYRDLHHKFDPGVEPLHGEEAVFAGVEDTLKLAGILFPEAAIGAIVVEHAVKPAAEAAAKPLAETFSGAIMNIYDIPSWRHF